MAKGRVTETEATGAAPKRGTSRARATGKRKRGRTIVALALVVFVIVASVVIFRRSYGITQSRELKALEMERLDLESQRALLEGRIRDESGRAKLTPALNQLGMRVPSDQQVRILPR